MKGAFGVTFGHYQIENQQFFYFQYKLTNLKVHYHETHIHFTHFELHFEEIVTNVEDLNATKQEMNNMGATWISHFKRKRFKY